MSTLRPTRHPARKSWRQLRLAGAFCLLSSPTLASAQALDRQYAVIRLETSEEESGASGINSLSQVAAVVSGNPYIEPCVWERGRYKRIGDTSGYNAGALDVSDAGVVVGFFEQADWHAVPFVWTRRSGGTIALPYLDGYDHGSANAVNNAGVIVGINRQYDTGAARAVQWVDGVVMELPNWGTWGGEAADINEAGWIVGWLIDQDERWQPVLWHDGIITELGALSEYSQRGEATGLNDVGQVTGWSRAGGYDHAFLWQDGEMVDIHDPPGSWYDNSYARAINNQTEIVGMLSDYPAGTAFIWCQERGMEELVTYLPPSAHWTNLDQAWDINDFGQIVGWGSRYDTTPWEHGYLMTPVYPTFTLDQPSPGVAGEVNMITARNLMPGAKVYFAYSTAGGGAIIPKCDIVEAALQIDDPMVAGTAIANANGVARLTGKVPSKWSGQEVLIQALIPSECDISNLIVVAFE
ncbi:MAG: hypothetical protein HND57_06730 [Planctomycetes bacterium]|nr:hypothetical protein [Planctomycetota bacterium]